VLRGPLTYQLATLQRPAAVGDEGLADIHIGHRPLTGRTGAWRPMVDKRLADTVTGALAQTEWEEEDVGGATLVSTGIESIPHFILRTTTSVDSSAVLDMCCPCVGNPTDEAVLLALRSNALLAADGSFFSSYVGAQSGGYLGGFVRVPVPAGLWLVEAVRPMLYLGARSLAMLRARVPGFIEACHSKGYSADSEVFPDVRSGRPMGVIDGSA